MYQVRRLAKKLNEEKWDEWALQAPSDIIAFCKIHRKDPPSQALAVLPESPLPAAVERFIGDARRARWELDTIERRLLEEDMTLFQKLMVTHIIEIAFTRGGRDITRAMDYIRTQLHRQADLRIPQKVDTDFKPLNVRAVKTRNGTQPYIDVPVAGLYLQHGDKAIAKMVDDPDNPGQKMIVIRNPLPKAVDPTDVRRTEPKHTIDYNAAKDVMIDLTQWNELRKRGVK